MATKKIKKAKSKAINNIIGRIEVASKESPIAVFYAPDYNHANLAAIFANTIRASEMVISMNKDNNIFVGYFDGTMPVDWVKRKLVEASNGNFQFIKDRVGA